MCTITEARGRASATIGLVSIGPSLANPEPMKLAYRWALAVLAVIVVVDVQLYQLAARGIDYLYGQAMAHLTVSSDVVLRRAEHLFDTYDRTLSGIGEVVGVGAGREGRLSDREIHRLLIRRHAITPSVQRLLVVETDGRLAATSLGFPAPNLNYSDQEYFRAQAESWDTGLYVGPRRFDGGEKAFIPVSRRIINDGSRIIAVVAAAIDPEALTGILGAQALPEGYVLRLFLRSGEPLACLPDVDSCYTRDWSTTPLFDTLIRSSDEGVFRTGEWFGDEAGPGAFASSAKYPLVVAVTASEGVLLEPWRRDALRYLLIGISSNLALVLIAIYAYRQVDRRRLAVQAFADANVNLERRVMARTGELRRSEARARLFMNTATDAVVVFDADHRIVEFNAAAETMFGYAAAEAIGKPLALLIPATTSGNTIPCACNGTSFETISTKHADLVARAKTGREFFIEITGGCTSEDHPRLCVCVIRDVSERRAMEHELKRLATTDALTGVLNRGAWTRRSKELVALARRYGRPLTLMILDADHFKRVNDTYGHPAGDRVLKALADEIDVRAADVVGRLGGEEFGVALPETDADCAMEFADRLLARVRARRVSEGAQALSFTVSVGLTAFDPARDEDLDAVLRRADRALYRAKQNGRDCCVRIDADDADATHRGDSAGRAPPSGAAADNAHA